MHAAIADGLVHVWIARPVDLLSQTELMSSYLSDDERTRAAGYKLEAPRTQFILGRGFLRRTLAGYLNVPPESLRFGTTGNEKPVLLECDKLHFNLSHTANAIALALSSDRTVGVDVEQLRSRRSLHAIAQQQYSIAEQRELETAGEEDKLAIFYRIWTCKEAYLKGLGYGFAQPLNSFAMQLDGQRYQPTPRLDEHLWSVISELRDDYALAIAATGDWQVLYL